MFEQSNRLYFELELVLVTVICRGNAVGKPISAREAGEYIFGYTLVNDWSARDIQAWELNAISFGATISPWVVVADALGPSRTRGLSNDVDLVDYLREGRQDNVLDINLEVSLQTSEGNQAIITRTSSKNLYGLGPK
ncbi:hypothetical protein EDB80DRAFT_689682 [Ilyonectria destructans]|nr:hypothetical protein EDB80DRAFT_689682 [Ilyonectria destructans]